MTLVVLSFTGFMQVRLATNPDPTDEPRGVSGYTFALPGEPDLDRILRTSNPISPRTHAPPIGMHVTRVAIDGTPVAMHPLLGATFDLLGASKFESVNEVMMEQGTEALEPFDVQLAKGAFRLQRRCYLDPSQPDLTVYTAPRALLEPRRAAASFSNDMLLEIFGTDDPRVPRAKKRALLQHDLAGTTDPETRAALERRISELSVTDLQDRRCYSMQFIERRHYDLNGPTALVDPDGWLEGLDTGVTFACDIAMGAWDSDALSFYATGTLSLPTY
jgi:hypothetical protein